MARQDQGADRTRNAAPGHILIRRLRRSELPAFADHLLRLDFDSRRRRFGRAVNDEFLTHYALGERSRPGYLEGAFVDGVLRGVAELRPYGPVTRRDAEAAFSIEPAFQQQGLGGRLMTRLLLVARNHGVRSVDLLCSIENRAIQKLARRHGGVFEVSPGEVKCTMPGQAPTLFSFAREALAEAAAGFAARWDRRLRAASLGAVALPEPARPTGGAA